MTESNQSVSAKQVRDVVALGKKYSKTAFPNPTREGCPNSSTLRAMAYRDRRLSLKDLPVSHVVTLLSLLPRVRPAAPYVGPHARHPGNSSIPGRTRRPVRSRCDLFGITLAGAASRAFRRSTEPNRSLRVATQQAPPPIAPLAITVNLASFSPTRGEEAKDSANKIHLPPKLLRVSFLLPVGMEPGEYAVRLKDSAGTVLKDTRALGRLNDGITSVEVDLDLTAASRGSFSLMIRPPGLSWRTFPVLVE